MNMYWRSMAAGLLFGMCPVVVGAADTNEPQAPEPAATTVAAEAADEDAKTFSMTIGGKDDEAGDGESKALEVEIRVDGDDEEAEDGARVEIAGKVVDRVIGELEKALEGLPEDVRRDLDADDLGELRDALAEIRALKDADNGHRRMVVSGDDDFAEQIIPVVAIVLLFGGPVVIVALVSYNNRRKRQMVHETIDRIIAQGKDVPVELLDALDKGRANGRSMLSRGVVNVALGVGIAGMLYGLGGEEAASLGLIPFCIGAAQLLIWKLERPAPGSSPVS